VGDGTATLERFAHTPFVCGHLGPDNGGHWEALLAASPAPVKVRSTGPLHGFAASRAPGLERVAGRKAWVWGRHLLSERSPTDWRDAAQDLGLAGFWVGGGEPRVHTDSLGVLEVYARELDGTTYFSNRVDPLVRIGSAQLHTDWEAWADQLFLCGFSHDRTAFEEVRRLDFAESRRWVDGRARRARDLPSWMLIDRRDGSEDDALDALVAQMPTGSDEASAMGLSGGWDSRMIAVLCAHRGLRMPTTLTSHNDTGTVADPELAPAVAEALGLENRQVGIRSPRQWVRMREAQLHRVEHETVLHMWMAPLARDLRRLGLPVWDGLLGDVLFRAAGISSDVLWAGPIEAQREKQWLIQGGNWLRTINGLRPDLLRGWHEDARRLFFRDTDVFTGLASELTMRVATTKSLRVLGAAPGRMLAPDRRVLLPFTTPDVVAAGAAIPPVVKAQTGWFGRLIERLDPVVGALPSTNDVGAVTPFGPTPAAQLQPSVVEWCAARIVSDDVAMSVFTPRAQQHLRAGRALGETGISIEELQWAQTLSSWRARYRDRLADERL
jgi:hypothetical protein